MSTRISASRFDVGRIREGLHNLTQRLSFLGPTLARLTVGLVFVGTGWGKLHSLPDVTEFFTKLGIPAPGFHARLVACTELLGGRLRIRRPLGEGGMGIVYEVHDQQRRELVALKALSRLEPSGVYRLKNEFRSLADVSHPSLCRLHELFSERDQWFFTMELVDGERFDHWVRPEDRLDLARLRAALRRSSPKAVRA